MPGGVVSSESGNRRKRSAFDKFLVQEDSLSLKLVFDNITHYVICGAVFAGLRYLSSPDTPPSLYFWPRWVAEGLALFALLLLFCTAGQTLELVMLGSQDVLHVTHEKHGHRHRYI